MQLSHTKLVLVSGEPFLSKVIEYVQDFERTSELWNNFRDKYEAYAISPNGFGLYFSGASPSGWTRPEGNLGFARPKDGTDAMAEVKAIPRLKKTWSIFGDSLIYELRYRLDGIDRCSSVSELWDGPEVYRRNDKFYALIPDPVKAAAEIKRKYPSVIIDGEPEKWQIPEGLSKIEGRLDCVNEKNVLEIVNG